MTRDALRAAAAGPAAVRAVADLRLVPAALAGWAAVLLALGLGWRVAAAMAVVGVALLAVGARRGWRGLVLAAAGVGAALAVVAGGQAWQVAQHPLHQAADRGAAATLEVALSGDPRPVGSTGYGGRRDQADRVVVPGEVRSATLGGRTWRAGGRVVLLAPAQGWDGLLPGQQVRVRGLLAPAGRSDLTVAVLRARGEPQVLGPAPAVQRAAEPPRSGLRDAAAAVLDPEPAGLLPALVVGDTSRMVPAVEEDFRTAGLTHLTAVSGTNVAIVCGAVLGLARLARAGPRTAAVLAALALIGFVVLCRPSPSVLRAAVMGGVTLLALVVGRTRSAVPALCAAVIGLLLVDPTLGTDPGFALSVLATGALVLLAPGWAAAMRARRVPPGVAEALAVPVAAHVATAPVVAGLSGEVSLVAVVANLLAAPAVAPATVLGVLAAVLAPVHAGVATVIVQLAGPWVSWLVAIGHHGAAVPDGSIGWPGGVRGGLLLAGLVLVVLIALRAPRLRVLAFAAALGALVVLAPTRYVAPGWPATGWAVVACDVGQGDALVLATAEPGRAVLVDAGADPGPVAGCLDRLGVDRLALAVITHLHADHLGGLAGALRGREVAAVAVGPGRSPRWAFAEVHSIASRAGVPLVALSAGQRLAWRGLTLDVLGPRTVPAARSDEDAEVDGTEVNDTSVVLRADTEAGTVLLTGDIELSAQAELLESGVDLRADVLKVPHHGSRYTAPEFLRAVRPRVALVSVGADNNYGHPNPGIVRALERGGTRLLRTDRTGDVAVVDGLAVAARGSSGPND